MTLVEKLKAIQAKNNSLVCVGIDPDRQNIPAFLWDTYPQKYAKNIKWRNFSVVFRFCLDIVDATAAHCCAFKPNLAFFESFGLAGADALARLTDCIRVSYPDHILVLDGKRGDIPNTAAQYAIALKNLGADAITVNPYLGPDTLQPFLDEGLGIIALCVTSNKDAAIFQNAKVFIPGGSLPVYQLVARTLQEKYGATGNLGLVTGATHPEELGEVRKSVGNNIVLLIPGIGKQVGDLEATIVNNGQGPALINVSRSVLCASSGEDFAAAAGEEARKTKDEINKYRAKLA